MNLKRGRTTNKNKQEFLLKLSQRLSDLTQEDIDKSLDYYSEIIDDSIEDGQSEDEAVEALGSPEEIASQILSDSTVTKKSQTMPPKKQSFTALTVILVILGLPLWLPLVATIFSLVLTAYILIWTMIVVLYAVVFAFAATSIAGFVMFVHSLITGDLIKSFIFLGSGIAFVGITILSVLISNLIVKLTVKLSKWIFCGIKNCFTKKKGVQNEN